MLHGTACVHRRYNYSLPRLHVLYTSCLQLKEQLRALRGFVALCVPYNSYAQPAQAQRLAEILVGGAGGHSNASTASVTAVIRSSYAPTPRDRRRPPKGQLDLDLSKLQRCIDETDRAFNCLAPPP